jgi:hypothetical protein
MHCRKFQYCIILFVILVVFQHAECEEPVNREIHHLLQYIENAGCSFIRNNKAYEGAEARAHIQKKYDYFKARIKTTDDFITLAATKSSMSGKPYKVRCNDREISCAEWLNAELQMFRSVSHRIYEAVFYSL